MVYISKIPAHTCIKQIVLLLLVLSSAGLSTAQGVQTCDMKAAVQQINSELERKQYDQAAKILDQQRACPAHSPLEIFQIGWFYGRARRFETALHLFKTVPQEVPDPVTHNYAIALCKFELGDYQGAIAILKPVQLSGTGDTKSINLLAVSYSKLGWYRQAYAILAEQTQKDSGDLSLYLNLVTVCAEGGDFAKAAEVAAQARELFPSSPDVFIVQGAAATLLGHLDQAYEDFAAGVRLAPSRTDARFFLALTDYKQGKFSDALSILRNAVNGGLVDSDLYYLMAECLLKLESANTNEALHELDRAINLNANSVSARTLRGKLVLDGGRASEALPDLELANRLDPDSRAVLYNLARAYRALGRDSEAQSLFRKLQAQTADTFNEFTDTRLNDVLTGKGEQP